MGRVYRSVMLTLMLLTLAACAAQRTAMPPGASDEPNRQVVSVRTEKTTIDIRLFIPPGFVDRGPNEEEGFLAFWTSGQEPEVEFVIRALEKENVLVPVKSPPDAAKKILTITREEGLPVFDDRITRMRMSDGTDATVLTYYFSDGAHLYFVYQILADPGPCIISLEAISIVDQPVKGGPQKFVERAKRTITSLVVQTSDRI